MSEISSIAYPTPTQVRSPLSAVSMYRYTTPNYPQFINGYLQGIDGSWGTIRGEDICFLREAEEERKNLIFHLLNPSPSYTVSAVQGEDTLCYKHRYFLFPPLGAATTSAYAFGPLYAEKKSGYDIVECFTSSLQPNDFHLEGDARAALSAMGYDNMTLLSDWSWGEISGAIDKSGGMLSNAYYNVASPIQIFLKRTAPNGFGMKYTRTTRIINDDPLDDPPHDDTGDMIREGYVHEEFAHFFNPIQFQVMVTRYNHRRWESLSGQTDWTQIDESTNERVYVHQSIQVLSAGEKVQFQIGKWSLLSSALGSLEDAISCMDFVVPEYYQNNIVSCNVDYAGGGWIKKVACGLDGSNSLFLSGDMLWANVDFDFANLWYSASEKLGVRFLSPDAVKRMLPEDDELPAAPYPNRPSIKDQHEIADTYGQTVTSQQLIYIAFQFPAMILNLRPLATHPQLTSYYKPK